MLTETMVVDLEACVITADDIKEILSSGQSGVCRALLSPDAAQYLLEHHNERNRGVKRHQRLFLQRQIESEKWSYNGETITIGDNGHVLNGQHRLSACWASKRQIEVLMVFGIPSGAFVTVDQGARRGGSDVLQIEGHKSCTILAGCLRQIDNYFKGAIGKAHANGREGMEGRGDNSFSLELLKRYPSAPDSVAKMYGTKMTQPSVASALHFLFTQKDAEQAEEFCNVVKNGFQVGSSYTTVGEAAGMLREWLMRSALGNKKTPPWVVANIWIKAWNAGRSGQLPKVLIYKDGVDRPPTIE